MRIFSVVYNGAVASKIDVRLIHGLASSDGKAKQHARSSQDFATENHLA